MRAQRQHVLAAAYARHPERFVNGQPHPADLPQAVDQPAAENIDRSGCPRSTIVTVDDLWVGPIGDALDLGALLIVDRRATLITSPLVSQCH